MSRRILPNRTNAMSIHQVAAAEEFATPDLNRDDVRPITQNSEPSAQTDHGPTLAKAPAVTLEDSIQQSLQSVGSGIQSLLSESLTLAKGEVTTGLRATVQQQVQESIKKSFPTLNQQVQKEARKVAAVHAESVVQQAMTTSVSELKDLVQQQNKAHHKLTQSISARLDDAISQTESLKQSNEEQRKVIVALVRKVTALENHATASSRHQQKTDQRLKAMEQPADLDAEWKDLLAAKQKPSSEGSDSAA